MRAMRAKAEGSTTRNHSGGTRLHGSASIESKPTSRETDRKNASAGALSVYSFNPRNDALWHRLPAECMVTTYVVRAAMALWQKHFRTLVNDAAEHQLCREM
jgi:hypothetical protein